MIAIRYVYTCDYCEASHIDRLVQVLDRKAPPPNVPDGWTRLGWRDVCSAHKVSIDGKVLA